MSSSEITKPSLVFFSILILFFAFSLNVDLNTNIHIESLFPLVAAFFMAVSYLSTRFLMSTESSVAIIFYYSLALFITSLIFHHFAFKS